MQDRDFSRFNQGRVPVHREGWRFVAVFAAAALFLFALWAPLGWLGLCLSAATALFFRDPERVTPTRSGLVVSPADGRVQTVDSAPPPAELGMGADPVPRVCIFMSLLDVHVNRIPISGRVTGRAYRPGRFFNASLDKASVFNERLALRLTLDDGRDLAVVQIAGLIARRICCDVAEGQAVRAGERFGLIRFGSRLDVYLPPSVQPLVAVGQTAIAGETVLADLAGHETARQGERR